MKLLKDNNPLSPPFIMSSSTSEIDVIPQFRELYLRYLQEKQVTLQPSEFKGLYARYLARNTEHPASPAQEKILEQIMLGIPLWLLSQQCPENLSQLAYIRLVNDISDDLLVIHTRIRSSFGFEQ